MQKPKFNILSTRDLPEDIIQLAAKNDIEIDCLSFIETESIINKDIKKYINQLVSKNVTVVFTSMNAVEAVAEVVNENIDWNVYCIGYATKVLVNEKLGATIKGEADDAASLAELIITNQEQEVYFFCGDIRRNELPDKLKASGIRLQEIIVYRTKIISHKIEVHYDGILFYSPSAVESFFSDNKAQSETVFFAIGKTTAAAILKFTSNKIILAEQPGKVELAQAMIKFFSNKKKTNEYIKE